MESKSTNPSLKSSNGSLLPSPSTPPTLVMSSSSKMMTMADQMSKNNKKKYVKQVTGRYKDTDLHLAAQRGDLSAVKVVIDGIGAEIRGLMAEEEFEMEVAEIRKAVANEVNKVGMTALMIAAEKGNLDVVEELMRYCDEESVARKNISGYSAMHLASKEGHHAIVQVLLKSYPRLSKTLGPANVTPLISAVERGRVTVVEELLSQNCSILEHAKHNGKNALHFAARKGHPGIVQALLDKDPQLARRTDKKGQTALHMAVKGTNCDVVKAVVDADPAIVMLPDKFGSTALHVATRKKRIEIVNALLLLPDTHVNALTRDHKTALDIAEGLPLSEESTAVKECLCQYGAVRANELNQPRDELRKTVTEIKKDVHTQLEQTRRTNKNVLGISKEIRKLHREGINNATNSVTVVAVLFATVAFAAIFTVPGGNASDGVAVALGNQAFKIFFIFNAMALFTSLAVVVVQITLVTVEVINKLMWLASVCTSVSFIASSYIVVGRRFQWAAILVTVIGGVTMLGVLGTMTYYVVKSKRSRSMRKKIRQKRNVQLMENTPSSPRSSSYSLILTCPSGLSPSQVFVDFSPSYDRMPHPDGKLEISIQEIWDKRAQENPSLYNGQKFRLKQQYAGYTLKEVDGKNQVSSVCLHLGLTDYRTFVGTNLSPLWKSFLVNSEDDSVRCQHTSSPLGNGAIVETVDHKILVLQRSNNVGEFPGHFVFPGGHSEPQEIGVSAHQSDNFPVVSGHLNDKVSKEMFDGIIREVVEEIGVPPTALDIPIFIGISRRLHNVRPTAFFFLNCCMESKEIHKLYSQAQDGYESTKLYTVSREDMDLFTVKMPGCHRGGYALYELMMRIPRDKL